LEARENDIAKLKHEVVETRKEMTDGISLIRRRAASSSSSNNNKSVTTSISTIHAATVGGANTFLNLPKRSSSESTHRSVASKTNSEDHEPFLIVNQEEFSEHASAITHAKFSSQGDLIASCDMDNIVRYYIYIKKKKKKKRLGCVLIYDLRIWSYKGKSFNPLKIKNSASSVLSLEWDARSDRFVSANKGVFDLIQTHCSCIVVFGNGHRFNSCIQCGFQIDSTRVYDGRILSMVKKKKKN
jgi:WD40 repeat protein